MNIIEKLNETVAVIREYYDVRPLAGIVLGSGLGNFKSEMDIDCEIPYEDIPHFPVSTVEGHRGTLIFGKLAGKPVVCMAGRFHFYEGYGPAEVAYPIRVMKFLGIEALLKQKKRSQWARRHHEMAIALTKYNIKISDGKEALLWVGLLLESAKVSTIGQAYLMEAKEIEIKVHELIGNFELAQTKLHNLKKVKNTNFKSS